MKVTRSSLESFAISQGMIQYVIGHSGIIPKHILTQRPTITRFKGISAIPQISIITPVPKPQSHSM